MKLSEYSKSYSIVLTVPSSLEKSFLLRLNIAKHFFKMVRRSRVLSTESKCGTHLTKSFRIRKYACKMLSTRSVEMPTVSAISHLVTRRSSIMIPLILSTISSVVTSFGRSSSKMFLRPRLNLI